MLDISACTGRTRYTAKDEAKSRLANKYIGRGSMASSTNAYAAAIGPSHANTGNYTGEDIVSISAEGNRRGRLCPDFEEIKKACDARALIITDSEFDRNRSYNIGERQVAAFLNSQGYEESLPGSWSPKITIDRRQERAIK